MYQDRCYNNIMDNKNINQRETAPLKLVFSTKLKEIMKEQSITQAELARRMHTSRTAVARVLDPKNKFYNTSDTCKSSSCC